MKVWVVMNRDIWGNSIEGIFKNKKDAEDLYESLVNTHHFIEEHEVIE